MNRNNNSLERKIYSPWLVVPGFVIFGIIFVIPTFASFYFAFCKWNLRTATWTGFDNFVKFFSMFNTKDAIPNTIVFTFWETMIKVVLGMILAVMLTSGLKVQNYMKSIIFIPTLFGSVVVAAAWSSILHPSGILNQALAHFGIEKIKWLTSQKWAMKSCIAIDIWKGMGTTLIIYIGGLSAIPKTYYEAAAIDGANAVQRFFRITLPLLVSSMNTILTLCLIAGFKNYDLIYALTDGGPAFSTEVLGSAVYKLFSTANYGIATTGYVVIFIFACAVVLPLHHWIASMEVEL